MTNEILREAVAAASRAEGDRCGALGRIIPAIEAIGDAVRDFVDAQQRVIAEGRRAYDACPKDAAPRQDLLAAWIRDIAEAHAERELVRAALADAGFDHFGFNLEYSAVRKREAGKDTGDALQAIAARTRRFLDALEQAVDADKDA